MTNEHLDPGRYGVAAARLMAFIETIPEGKESSDYELINAFANILRSLPHGLVSAAMFIHEFSPAPDRLWVTRRDLYGNPSYPESHGGLQRVVHLDRLRSWAHQLDAELSYITSLDRAHRSSDTESSMEAQSFQFHIHGGNANVAFSMGSGHIEQNLINQQVASTEDLRAALEGLGIPSGSLDHLEEVLESTSDQEERTRAASRWFGEFLTQISSQVAADQLIRWMPTIATLLMAHLSQ